MIIKMLPDFDSHVRFSFIDRK